MKRKIPLLFLMALIVFAEDAFSQITFHKTFGDSSSFGTSVQQTSDGGYIFSGTTGEADMILIKTNAYGDTSWIKTYGSSNYEICFSVQQTSDGGYILGGGTGPFISGTSDAYLVKTNANGDVIWSKTYGGPNQDEISWVRQTSDGGYIAAGSTNSFGAGSYDLYLIRTDSLGDTLWTKAYGGPNYEYRIASVESTNDNGFIIDCSTSSFGPLGNNYLLIKTDANGDTLWAKAFGTTGSEYGFNAKQTADGGYIITGWIQQNQLGCFLTKTDSIGNLIFSKAYETDDARTTVQPTFDGGYIIGGGYFLIRTDSNGDTLWAKAFGIFSNFGSQVQQTADSGFIFLGAHGYITGDYQLYAIKTDANGNSGCMEYPSPFTIDNLFPVVSSAPVIISSTNTIVTSFSTVVGNEDITNTFCSSVGIEEMKENNFLSVYPNPATDKLTITTNNNSLSEIILYDIASRKLLQQKFTSSVTLNTAQLARGIYIYEVRSKDGLKKGKVVKE